MCGLYFVGELISREELISPSDCFITIYVRSSLYLSTIHHLLHSFILPMEITFGGSKMISRCKDGVNSGRYRARSNRKERGCSTWPHTHTHNTQTGKQIIIAKIILKIILIIKRNKSLKKSEETICRFVWSSCHWKKRNRSKFRSILTPRLPRWVLDSHASAAVAIGMTKQRWNLTTNSGQPTTNRKQTIRGTAQHQMAPVDDRWICCSSLGDWEKATIAGRIHPRWATFVVPLEII